MNDAFKLKDLEDAREADAQNDCFRDPDGSLLELITYGVRLTETTMRLEGQ